MTTFRALQKECVKRGLPSCKDENITRETLLQMIRESDDMEHYERLVYNHDPDFYENILSLIPNFPDIHPHAKSTKKKMKKEKQNPWHILYEELVALGREGDDAEDERELMEAINSGKLGELQCIGIMLILLHVS